MKAEPAAVETVTVPAEPAGVEVQHEVEEVSGTQTAEVEQVSASPFADMDMELLEIFIEEAGEIRFVHAASSDLTGVYEGGRVVQVPLTLYLERVDRFCGVMITRFPGT